MVNTGTFDVLAGAGGARAIVGDFDNQGQFRIPDVSVSLNGAVTNTGAIAVGNGQSLSLTSTLTQQPAGTINLGVAGSGGVNSASINVTDQATIDGTLDLTFDPSATFAANDSFIPITYGSSMGEFATITNTDLGNGLVLSPTYNANALVLSASLQATDGSITAILFEDVNGDTTRFAPGPDNVLGTGDDVADPPLSVLGRIFLELNDGFGNFTLVGDTTTLSSTATFDGLQPGEYRVTTESPPGLTANTTQPVIVTLGPGQEIVPVASDPQPIDELVVNELAFGFTQLDPVNSIDLRLTGDTVDRQPAAGSSYTDGYLIENLSSTNATDVVATITLPTGVNFLSGSVPGGAVSAIGNQVTATLPTLPASSTAAIDLNLGVEANVAIGTALTSTGFVAAAEVDTTGRNNTSSSTDTVTAAASIVDLRLTGDTNDSRPTPGSTYVDNYLVENLSTTNASNVAVTFTLPTGVSFISGSIPGGTISGVGNQVTATLSTLAATSSASFDLSLQVDVTAAVGTVLTSTAIVTLSETDPDPGNNTTTSSDTVAALPPPTPSISGHVECDFNGDGSPTPVEDAFVFVDINGNRIHDAAEPSTTTDDMGSYSFFDIMNPSVTVVARVPAGCTTIPASPGVARQDVVAGDLARSIDTVDLNGDGFRDLVVASDLSGTLTVLTNEGGQFPAGLAQDVALGERPQHVFVFESPQIPSPTIAVAGIGTSDNGGAVFQIDSSLSVSAIEIGNGPIESALADFDNNGVIDVVAASLRSSDVRIAMNGSDDSTVIATARQVRTIEIGDLNGDENADIAVAGYGYSDDLSSELQVLVGDGLGEFSDPVSVSTAPRTVSLKIAGLNPNVDSSNQLFALSDIGLLTVYRLESGSLVEINSVDVGGGANSFDVGDYNGDGVSDLVISNLGDQRIDLLVGDGSGNFSEFTTVTNVPAPADVVVDDLDNDGRRDDIAVANFYQDDNLGQPGSAQFVLPSSVTVLRVDVGEDSTIVASSSTAIVDFSFASAAVDSVFDVTGEGAVTALDALQIINVIDRDQPEGELTGATAATDVNGDGQTTAIDALIVINYMNRIQNLSVDSADLTSNDDEIESVAIDVVFKSGLF